ncbi:ribose-phosphate pyrophosphokinase [Ensifer sp. IC3342]|nr:ribose-phosphate pyrophosphokinase [Ensifer sp. BRP08]MCA1450846.1 ribose-phosphate pyrophosphokinase [Ensifer sp. IC3342]
MRIFALNTSQDFGRKVALAVGVPIDEHEERDFEDGEHKTRPLVSVRGEDVYVLQNLNGDGQDSANDKLCKLLFFIACCRECGASRVTAVVPYLAYARKDRQTKARDPVTTRYMAQLFEAVGTDQVITLDVHNTAAFQNAFRCRTIHLSAKQLFADVIARKAAGGPVTIFSPDSGGIKRAQLLKEAYERLSGDPAGFGFMEKRRSRGVVSGELFAGEVEDATVFIVDDMISTGSTMLRAAEACRQRGARAVYAMATHGLFSKGAEAMLAHPAVDATIVTDSIAPFRLPEHRLRSCVEVVPSAPLVAEAIRRLTSGGSISELLGDDD